MSSWDKVKSNKTTIQTIGQKRSIDEICRNSTTAIPNYRGFQRPQLRRNDDRSLVAGNVINLTSIIQTEYSQRKKLALTPTPTQDPKLDLAHSLYGLPQRLVSNLASMGISSIYPWQSECLLNSGALDGKVNLVYSAPTGGGKSLVADVLMLKNIVENPGKKALLVLP